ncbi:hypothetical protein H1R20_g10103, partial [Candolleomyces eurysporus]
MLSLFGTAIMRVAYGFDDIQRNKAHIQNAEALMLGFCEAAVPGRFLVNVFPSLRHIPSWCPGAGFQRFLGNLAQISFKTRYLPFEEANGRKGSYPSMAADLIDRFPEDSNVNRAKMESIARDVCGVAYVVKEVGRWFTVAPLGVPHSNSEDDEYDGFFIPKGTIIFQNNWAMMHNPDVFDKPFEFIPERYLKDGQIDLSVPDAEAAAFGHGRRNDAMFLMAASLLATYTLTIPKDEAGKIPPMKLQSQDPLVIKLVPFKYQITLRPERERLLLE